MLYPAWDPRHVLFDQSDSFCHKKVYVTSRSSCLPLPSICGCSFPPHLVLVQLACPNHAVLRPWTHLHFIFIANEVSTDAIRSPLAYIPFLSPIQWRCLLRWRPVSRRKHDRILEETKENCQLLLMKRFETLTVISFSDGKRPVA